MPLIVPQAPGDFSEWTNGVPVVDLGASLTSFTGTGIASASAVLSSIVTVDIAGSGTGEASASAQLAYSKAVPASGTGIASASAILGYQAAVPASGTGIASASALLVSLTTIYVQGSGSGIGGASAVLIAAPIIVPGKSRIASPRQSSFRIQDYAAHSFAYRKVRAGQERVRHIGD